MRALQNAGWIAGWEMRRAWLSYPLSAALLSFFGVVGAHFADEALAGPGGAGAAFRVFYLDFFFLAATSLLAGNFFSRDYALSWGDTFSRRLAFLRRLPVSPGEIVAGRVLSMLAAAVINVPLFFLALYALSGALGGLLEGTERVWFAGLWFGAALAWGGLYLYLETGTSGRVYNLLMFPLIALFAALAGVAQGVFGLRVVELAAAAAREGGPLAAAGAVLLGAAVLAAMARAAARRVGRRELLA